MPKSYSEQEKEYIKKRLKEEAAKCLAKFGVRHTTVDEIVRRVNIPKGTFYLFYQSKELLLFEVILEEHEMIERKVYQAVSKMKQDGDIAGQLTKIVCDFFLTASKSPILKMINTNEVEILARKLPPEVLKKHLEHDSLAMEKVFLYYRSKGKRIRIFSALRFVRFILPRCMKMRSGKSIMKMSFIFW